MPWVLSGMPGGNVLSGYSTPTWVATVAWKGQSRCTIERGYEADPPETEATLSFLYLQYLRETPKWWETWVSTERTQMLDFRGKRKIPTVEAAGWAARAGNGMGKCCWVSEAQQSSARVKSETTTGEKAGPSRASALRQACCENWLWVTSTVDASRKVTATQRILSQCQDFILIPQDLWPCLGGGKEKGKEMKQEMTMCPKGTGLKLKAVVLKRRQFCPSRDIWKWLETQFGWYKAGGEVATSN